MKIQSIPAKMKNLLLILIGVVCVLATSYAIFHSGFFRPHDFTHAARIVEMNRSLNTGEFPVRWSQNFGFGYGMPLFNFYAPLPYYVAQIPYVLTHDAILSIKFVYLVNSILAFLGMYLFGMTLWGKKGGVISSVAFTFSTYRAVDLYVRGALGEATAMVVLPFALYGILRIKTHKIQGILITALSLAVILLSHNLIGMISIGVVGLYGILMLGRKKILPLLLSILLALSLSSFYILPAFFEKDFTRVESSITTGYFDFHNHFVAIRQFVNGVWGYGGSQPGLEDGISFALGYIPMLLCVVAAIGVLKTRKKIQPVFILALFLAGSLLMATNKSVFVWEHVGVLKYMQFPWRFLSFAHVFLSAIAGGAVILIQKCLKDKAAILVVVAIVGAFVLLQSRLFTPETFVTNTDQYYRTDAEFIRSDMSKTLNDYLPRDQTDNPTTPLGSDERLTVEPFSGAKVSNVVDRGYMVTAQIDCQASCPVSVNIFEFPGWRATIDGKTANLATDDFFHTYFLRVPQGTHAIDLRLEDTPVRKVGNSLSIVALIAILWITGRQYVKRTTTSRS